MLSLNRRKFLLFAGKCSALLLSGCTSIVETENMGNLEKKIREILSTGKKLTIKWDCGGDEALVYPYVDGKGVDFGDPLFLDLDMFIINFLELPSAGEFAMDGKGEIILEEESVYLVCESILRGYEDYTMDGESLGWKDTTKVEEMYSGKHKLFE